MLCLLALPLPARLRYARQAQGSAGRNVPQRSAQTTGKLLQLIQACRGPMTKVFTLQRKFEQENFPWHWRGRTESESFALTSKSFWSR